MAEGKKRNQPSLSNEEILAMVEKGQLPVYYLEEHKFEDSFNEENLAKFITGEITWAELQGMTKEEAYAIANKAFSMFNEGKQHNAKNMLESLVLANPQDWYFHSLLASFYQRMELNEEAIDEYAIALELNPNFLDAHVNRGELLLQNGQFIKALEHLQKAVELDPQGTHPSSIRARALARATATVISENP